MSSISVGSFFTRMRQKFFDWRINLEIFERIFPHTLGEKDCGYSFRNNAEMDSKTEELNAQELLDTIERHARNMPEGYGKAFRHIMHRDLNKRLLMFEKVARRRVSRECDPRFIATSLEPAQ